MRWLALTVACSCGCAVRFKAIDVKQSAVATSLPGGGCVDPKLAVTTATANEDASEATTFRVAINAQELKKQAADYPLDGCIESYGELRFQVSVSEIAAGPDCGQARGTIQFKRFVLTSDKPTPATLAVQCADARASLEVSAEVQQVVQSCIDSNVQAVGEWLRQALNAGCSEIDLAARVTCSADACFDIKSTVKARFADPVINVGKSCSGSANAANALPDAH